MVGQAGQGSSHGSSQGSRDGGKVRPGHRRVAQWTRGYARLPGIPDEYIGQDGAPREVWTRFFEAFAELTPGDIERRFGDQAQPACAAVRKSRDPAERTPGALGWAPARAGGLAHIKSLL